MTQRIKAVFFFPSLVVLIIMGLSYFASLSDRAMMCNMHIKDTQRYLSIKSYDIIYLYSEACSNYPPPYPHRLESLRVDMEGDSMWASSSWKVAWFGVPYENRRINCTVSRFGNHSESTKATIRMLFTEVPGLFNGLASPSSRRSTYNIKCPTTLKVIRFNKK